MICSRLTLVAALCAALTCATGARPDPLTCLGAPFELLYELNALDPVRRLPDSLLLRESYSNPRGHLALHAHLDRRWDAHHFWLANATHRQLLWLTPFVCRHRFEPLTDASCAAPSPRLVELLPAHLSSLLCAQDQQVGELRGLSALLLNLFKPSRSPLRFHQLDVDNLLVLDQPEFSFRLVWPPNANQTATDCDLLQGLQIQIELNRKISVAVFTVLRLNRLPAAQSNGPIAPPYAYQCPSPIDMPPALKPDFERSDVINGRHLFYLRVGVARGQYEMMDSTSNWPRDALEPLTLADSAPGVYHMASLITFTLLLDHAYKTVAVQLADQLRVWDYNLRHYFQVTGGATQCDRIPIPLASTSIFPETGLAEPKTCDDEGVALELGDLITLRLNHAALMLLNGRLPFDPSYIVRNHSDNLLHVQPLAEVLPHQLCLFKQVDRRLHPIPTDFALLSRRYVRLPDNRYRILMTSVIIFTKALAPEHKRLMVRLNFELLDHQPYSGFSGNVKNLIDLSSCTRSATLFIEYDINESLKRQIMRISTGFRATVRYLVAEHLNRRHLIPMSRISSVQVMPLNDDLHPLKVAVRLLDKLVPTRDAIDMGPFEGDNDITYLELLQSSPQKSLVKSRQECAQFCDFHSCIGYIYCKYQLSCYLFNGPHANLVGGMQNMYFHCQGYRIMEPLKDDPAPKQWWRDDSPNLDKVLDNVASEIESGSGPFLTFVLPVGPKERPIYHQHVRLTPKVAYYHHDQQPDQSDVLTPQQFTVHTTGYRLEPVSSVKPHHGEVVLDLEVAKWGFITFQDEFELADCERLCSDDTVCMAFSHCSYTGECIITKFDGSQSKNEDYGSGGVLKLVADTNCIIMKRQNISNFERLGQTERVDLEMNFDETVETVDANDCATRCLGMGGDCHHFDTCWAPQKDDTKLKVVCLLNAQGNPQNPIPVGQHPADQTPFTQATCTRFVKNHLSMFTRIPNKQLKSHSTQFVEGMTQVVKLSLSECAHLCEKEDECGAFEYCVTRAYEESKVSCTLGSNETLQATASELVAASMANGKGSILVSSFRCSVFAYKKGTRGLSRKRNRFNNVADSFVDLPKSSWIFELVQLIRLDFILLITTFLFTFFVSDRPLAGLPFMFHRMDPAEESSLRLNVIPNSEISSPSLASVGLSHQLN